ncbi:MAG TPA: F0F1 ATP synthase subunit B [Saprospiraceae bacterium]|nr:ATP synthase F0 subunit B [Saprospirales bacterium]HRQ29895.1 F0F1 ATP synthase subunit B [Saprospiraceae bacterium]
MIFLADFSVIKPEPGLFIWAVVIFVIFWYLIIKFAFRPIVNALEDREGKIQEALDKAKKTNEEMERLQADNEKLLAQAREERSKILNEAKGVSDKIIQEAKDKAKQEAAEIVEKAMVEINAQKTQALSEVKNVVGNIALEIAEKVVKKELSKDQGQQEYVKSLIDEFNMN